MSCGRLAVLVSNLPIAFLHLLQNLLIYLPVITLGLVLLQT